MFGPGLPVELQGCIVLALFAKAHGQQQPGLAIEVEVTPLLHGLDHIGNRVLLVVMVLILQDQVGAQAEGLAVVGIDGENLVDQLLGHLAANLTVAVGQRQQHVHVRVVPVAQRLQGGLGFAAKHPLRQQNGVQPIDLLFRPAEHARAR